MELICTNTITYKTLLSPRFDKALTKTRNSQEAEQSF